jgi:hypothetical protein
VAAPAFLDAGGTPCGIDGNDAVTLEIGDLVGEHHCPGLAPRPPAPRSDRRRTAVVAEYKSYPIAAGKLAADN